jgi:flavin reductase (DIM6/NTAB) family NADH-FMN oxidoreductase RutF
MTILFQEMRVKTEINPGTYLYPMPTVLVGAMADGKPNFMTAAFVGIMNINPPVISISLGKSHFTTDFVKKNKTFSVNLPPTELAAKVDYCGIVSGKSADKSAVFTPFFGKLKTAPMVKECRLSIEASLIQTIDFDVDIAFIGRIESVFCDDDCLVKGVPDIAKVDPIIFSMGQNKYYSVGRFIGDAWSIGKKAKETS